MKKLLICLSGLLAVSTALIAAPAPKVNLDNVDAAIQSVVDEEQENPSNSDAINSDILVTADLYDYIFAPISDSDSFAEDCFHAKEGTSQWDNCIRYADGYEVEYLYYYKATPQEIKEQKTAYKGAYVEEVTDEYGDPMTVVISDKELKDRPHHLLYRDLTFRQQKVHLNIMNPKKVGCKAYPLTNNWLITSATCPLLEQSANPDVHREISSISVAGKKLNIPLNNEEDVNNNIKLGENVLLIRVPANGNDKLIAKLNKKAKVKLLAFSEPDNIFAAAAYGKFYIHTSRFDNQRLSSDKRAASLKNGSLNGYTFKASSFFDGTATDPFFLIKGNREYLMGFSTAKEEIKNGKNWSGDNSDEYKALTVEDFRFIVSSIGSNALIQTMFMDVPGNSYIKQVKIKTPAPHGEMMYRSVPYTQPKTK